MAASILGNATLGTGDTYAIPASTDIIVMTFAASLDLGSRALTSCTFGGVEMTIVVNQLGGAGGANRRAVIAWIDASGMTGTKTWTATWSAGAFDAGRGEIYALDTGGNVTAPVDTFESAAVNTNTTTWTVGYTGESGQVAVGSMCMVAFNGVTGDGDWTSRSAPVLDSSSGRGIMASRAAPAGADAWDLTPVSSTSGALAVAVFTDTVQPVVTSIGGDDVIDDSETAAAYAGSGFSNSTDVVRLKSASLATSIDQTTTETDATSGTFAVNMDNGSGQAIPFSLNQAAAGLLDSADAAIALTATLYTGSLESIAVSIDVEPQTGTDVVVASAAIGTGSTSAWQGLNFTPVKGDQIQFKTATEDDLSVGYTGTVTIAADGTPTIDYGANPVPDSDSFLCRYFDASEPAWTADSTTSNWASITLDSGAVAASVVGGVVAATLGRARRIKRWKRR